MSSYSHADALKTIWLKPRATLRWLLANEPSRYVWVLGGAYGVVSALARSVMFPGENAVAPAQLLTIALILGPIFGIIGLAIGAFLTRVVGIWLGGHGTNREVLPAVAWSYVPGIAMIIPVGFGLFASGGEVAGAGTGSVTGLLIGLSVAVLAIWNVLVYCQTVAEAHGFSAWRGFGTLILSNILAIVVVLAIAFLAALLIAPFQ